MLSQEKFNEIELEYGCGYWHECCDRACPCAITVENKGLTQKIWDSFKKEQAELAENFDDIDMDYDPLIKCTGCGHTAYESELYDGLCFDCESESIEDVEDNYDNCLKNS